MRTRTRWHVGGTWLLGGLMLAGAGCTADRPAAGTAAGSAAGAAPPAAAQASELDELDVLKVIPQNYKLVLENEHVRVIEARIPPGTVEPPHRHLSGVSIAMTDYDIEHLQPNGEWTPAMKRTPGVAYWSEGSVHQVRNVGKTTSHTIRIELKNVK